MHSNNLNQTTMGKKLLIACLLFTSLIACKSKSAFDYSQNVVAKERSLEKYISETEDKVEKYADKEQFDSIAVAGEKMEKMIQDKIDEINAMDVPKAKEADNFKAAIMKYFNYMKSIYTGYKNVGRAASAEERTTLVLQLQKLVGEKQAAISDMQRAQKKYAEANGFKVE